MPRPTDVEGVHRIHGFVNYLVKFIPKLSDVTEPIRQLTRKDVPWNWSELQENAFQEMKSLVKKAPVLAYFDNEKTVHIQCDASERGLGAALLQNGKPERVGEFHSILHLKKWMPVEPWLILKHDMLKSRKSSLLLCFPVRSLTTSPLDVRYMSNLIISLWRAS